MKLRTITPTQLANRLNDRGGVWRIHTDTDVVPGGYLACMLPLLVDWDETDPDGEDAHAVLRLVRYGGNPLERTTVFRSLRVPVERVESVELTLVPYGQLARGTPMQHAQLRFIFQADHQPALSGVGDPAAGSSVTCPDLVLGWGGWRRAGERFSLRRALDGAMFGLSLRAYAGAQCYLEDHLRGRDWFSYPLRLPGGREGLGELLRVSLALGDGVARQTMKQMLDSARRKWREDRPSSGPDAAEAEPWAELGAFLDRTRSPADAPALPGDQRGYHALARSCVMLARYSVLLATWRMIDRGHDDGVNMKRLPRPALGPTEKWMKAAAHAELPDLLAKAPLALRYVLKYPQSLPEGVPEELDAAGLLQRSNGQRVEIRYGKGHRRPYGRGGLNP